MGKSIIMHIDEPPYIWGQPRRVDGTLETGAQFIGDLEKGRGSTSTRRGQTPWLKLTATLWTR